VHILLKKKKENICGNRFKKKFKGGVYNTSVFLVAQPRLKNYS
jgi:hypothetical protein